MIMNNDNDITDGDDKGEGVRDQNGEGDSAGVATLYSMDDWC